MRVACPACGATYKVGDEKVAGRVVKIRCKRCSTVIVVDGTPSPAAQTPSLTGQRNEDSVLFSLSMLAPAPAPAPPTSIPEPSSGLIDLQAIIRANPPAHTRSADDRPSLDVGGLYAPVLAPPPDVPSPRAATWWPWLVLVAVALPILVVFAGWRFLPERPQPTTSVVTAAAAPPPVETSPATASPSPLPVTLRIVASATPASTHPVVAAVATTTATTSAKAPALAVCCAGESETACEMRRSVGAACEGPPFDRNEAARLLAAVNVAMCKTPDGPHGRGHVAVTFQPSGAVTTAEVDTAPFAGSATAGCIARAYRAVTVPAFSGAPVKVGKHFDIE